MKILHNFFDLEYLHIAMVNLSVICLQYCTITSVTFVFHNYHTSFTYEHYLYIHVALKTCPYSDDRRCSTTQACIRSDRWCNNVVDCEDGTDEECCKY